MKKLLTLITMLFSVGVLSQEPIYLECRSYQFPELRGTVFTLFPDKDEVRMTGPNGVTEKRITWSPKTVTIATTILIPTDTYRIDRETLKFTFFDHISNNTGVGTCEIVDTSGNQI